MTSAPTDQPDARGAAWRAWARGLVRVQGGGVDGVDVVRAGLCAGGAVLGGWWFGDVAAGVMASIGAFTVLYGAGRPYRSRARQLALLALAFAAVVVAGARAEASVAVSVVVIAVVAVLATWLCEAADTGPPGAYMVVLAGATATAVPHADTEAWRLGLLVLAGGALSWCAHLLGALAGPRRPEKAAVAAGADAVADLVAAVGTARYPAARDRAARAMHRCWVVLSEQQPGRSRPDGTVERLRALALELHGLLGRAVRAHDDGRPVDPDAADRVRALAAAVADPPPAPRRLGAGDVPWGGPGALRSARALLATGSPWRAVLARVAVASVVAGVAGSVFGLDHANWAVAAAVLVLCQGLGWAGTLERAVLRLAGTWIGLLLAASVLGARPAGVGLAVTIAVLQSAVQLVVPRNYGLGVVLITPLALTIGSAGHPADLGALLLARGVDTTVGCAIGVVVFLLVRPGAALPEARTLVAATLRDAARVIPHLVDRSTASPAARAARRDLNQRVLTLADAHRVGELAAPMRPDARRTAWWPALDAAHRLAHQVLAACWSVETGPGPGLSPARADALTSELAALAEPSRRPDGDRGRTAVAGEHGFLAPELAALRASLPAPAG